jgi:hypothetical protein
MRAWNEGNYPNLAIYFPPHSGFRAAFRIGSHGYAFGWYNWRGFELEHHKVKLPAERWSNR